MTLWPRIDELPVTARLALLELHKKMQESNIKLMDCQKFIYSLLELIHLGEEVKHLYESRIVKSYFKTQ